MPIVIVEGVDGSGKSTFVEELSLEAPDQTVVLHRGPIKHHPLMEYAQPIEQVKADDWLIADRWHVGELVYGPLYRGESKLTQPMNTFIELLLDSRGAARVILTTEFDEVRRRLEARGEDLLQPEHLRLVCDFYATYAETTPNWIGTATPDAQTILEAASLASRCSVDPDSSYVGSLEPEIVFCGEARVASRWSHLNPFAPYERSAGHYLFTALDAAMHDRSYGVCHQADMSLELWQFLGQPKVVALGMQAFAEITAPVVPKAVMHPQEAMLNHVPVSTYGEVIASVVGP